MLKLHCPSVPECRNWQTNRTQNPAHFTGRVGSSPTSGTTLFTLIYKNDRLHVLNTYQLSCNLARICGIWAKPTATLGDAERIFHFDGYALYGQMTTGGPPQFYFGQPPARDAITLLPSTQGTPYEQKKLRRHRMKHAAGLETAQRSGNP